MIETNTPHKLHILVCTNARHDGTPSCGDSGEAQRVFETLKARLKEAKLPVRVSRTGCLGPCAQGPNVMCYPHGVWFQAVGEGDVAELEAKVRGLLAAS
jgi:NADH:ubiquinone oxidoreductase subunit E